MHVRTEEDFEKFLLFLNKNNCNTDSFEIQKSSIIQDEYGLKAKRDFQKGDLIFQIPKNIILTTNDALNSRLGYYE
jgi:hypothetical protein